MAFFLGRNAAFEANNKVRIYNLGLHIESSVVRSIGLWISVTIKKDRNNEHETILVFLSILAFAWSGPELIPAPQTSLGVTPEAWIPYGNYANGLTNSSGSKLDDYSVGGGIDLSADMSLFGFLGPFLETGYDMVPLANVSGSSLTFAEGGGGLSIYAFPVPRLMARIGGSGGIAYASSTGAGAGLATYWKAKAELGYRFSPSFSILANGGLSQLIGHCNPPSSKGFSPALSSI